MYATWSKVVQRLEEGFIVLLLAAMALITFIQVVLRYLFGTGLLWAVELTGYLFGWLVLFGASYLLKERGHIGVDILVRRLRPSWRRCAGLVAVIFCAFYAAVMFAGGYKYVFTMYVLGSEAEDIPVQRWVLLLVIPLGMAMFFARLGQIGWRIGTGRDPGFLLADEGDFVDDFHKFNHKSGPTGGSLG